METEQRLIDANLLIGTCEEIAKHEWNKKAAPVSWSDAYEGFIDTIGETPTVDAVEVVHAEWLDIRFDSMWRSMLATCSHCKVRGEVRVKSNECGFAVPDSDHCPHCGAKMDGGSK